MKKLILILALFSSIGCSKEEDCQCDMKVYISDGNTNSSYIVTGVPSDCNGNVTADRSIVPPDHFPTMICE
jgi:hypothetical protein